MRKKLPNEYVKEMKHILGIAKRGKNYEQDIYHCGTSHCFAGWKCVLDYAKETGSNTIKRAKFTDTGKKDWENILRDFCMNKIRPIQDSLGGFGNVYYEYAQFKWSLNSSEAFLLFSADATLNDLIHTIGMFEDGYRFNQITDRWEEVSE